MINTPPKGKAGEFARAIVSKLPEEITFRDAALMIGCSESSAAQQGYRWAKNPDVIAYVATAAAQRGITLKKWQTNANAPTPANAGDLFEPITAAQVIEFLNNATDDQLSGSLQAIAAALAKRMTADDIALTPEQVITYLRTASSDELTERIYDIANIACERVGIVGTPEQIAEMIMKNPLTKPETKLAAAKALMKQAQPEPMSKRESQKHAAKEISQQLDLYSPYMPMVN